MAYGGGYLVKPVQSENGSIGELFLAGQAQVQKVRDKVREERRVQSKALGEATDFVATGIQDMDSYWAKAGSDARTKLMELQQANRNGEISRSEVVAQSAAITGEMSMIGQLPTIIKEQRDAIIAEQEKEGYSGLTLAEFDRTWFKDISNGAYSSGPTYIPARDAIPAVPDVVATQADIDGGAVDIYGKPAVAGSIMKKGSAAVPKQSAKQIDLQSYYKPVLIGNKQHMEFTYQYLEKGSNEVKTKTILKPLRDHINPSKKKYFKVDDKKEVAAFKKNIGDTGFTFTGADGVQQSIYQPMQTTANGTQIMGRISDPKDIEYVQRAIEQEITSKGMDWMAAYAFDVLGARTPFGDGATGIPLTDEQIERKFPSSIYFDYDSSTAKGSAIEFEDDPLMLDVDEQGNTVLSESTIKLVKAHYRNQLMASINVDTEVYKDRARASTTRSTKDTNTRIAPASYSVGGKGYKVSGLNLLSRAVISQNRKNKLTGNVNEADPRMTLSSQEASLRANGVLEKGLDNVPTSLKNLHMASDYDLTTQGAVNVGGVLNNFKDVLNVNTFTNNKFKDITGFFTSVNTEGQPIIILTGNATYGEVSSTIKTDGSNLDSKTTTGESSYVAEGMTLPLTDEQAQSFYLQIFDDKKGIPELAKILTELQYDRNTRDVKKALHLAQVEINKEKTVDEE